MSLNSHRTDNGFKFGSVYIRQHSSAVYVGVVVVVCVTQFNGNTTEQKLS